MPPGESSSATPRAAFSHALGVVDPATEKQNGAGQRGEGGGGHLHPACTVEANTVTAQVK